MATKKTKRSRGRPNKEPSLFGEKPNLTDTQWRALEREWRGCREEHLNDEWPSGTAAEIVARDAGVSRQAVHNWRTNPKYRHEYRRGLDWLLIERLTRSLTTGDSKEPDSKLTRQQIADILLSFVKQDWTGSVQSPIDEKVYLSPDKYIAHLMAAGNSRGPATDDSDPAEFEWVKFDPDLMDK